DGQAGPRGCRRLSPARSRLPESPWLVHELRAAPGHASDRGVPHGRARRPRRRVRSLWVSQDHVQLVPRSALPKMPGAGPEFRTGIDENGFIRYCASKKRIYTLQRDRPLPRKPSEIFTDKELEVMKVIWELGEATVKEVRGRQPGRPHYNNV